jgi:hypothetical protein
VKVDILVPPTLGLPEVCSDDIITINDIPVMPLFDLLVMKLQGWNDHRNSSRADFRAKVSADVEDVYALLETAEEEDLSYDDEIVRHEPEFTHKAATLAGNFVLVNRGQRRWRHRGFPV